ncbi:hypothetical protein QKT49_gp236 [Acanthamoeba castellanii medusavirus]|uniref:UBA domain-containing protein n=1 Tax=Acanthamoeba castellanii medusavirus J1 TaxID=3114988 RepID=A0A3T1CXF3_9VIRU|nr:hypothetical protein QKT49_gp236 [Acanthamoeba castellanii medusavirus]BBI30527.1 hypothetical protein [Acanthamoeba castellanii medusavirus J1]
MQQTWTNERTIEHLSELTFTTREQAAAALRSTDGDIDIAESLLETSHLRRQPVDARKVRDYVAAHYPGVEITLNEAAAALERSDGEFWAAVVSASRPVIHQAMAEEHFAAWRSDLPFPRTDPEHIFARIEDRIEQIYASPSCNQETEKQISTILDVAIEKMMAIIRRDETTTPKQ